MSRRGLLGVATDRSDRKPGGGCFPMRTHYTPAQRQALHELAESRPDPITYARERARILDYDRKTSERLEQR